MEFAIAFIGSFTIALILVLIAEIIVDKRKVDFDFEHSSAYRCICEIQGRNEACIILRVNEAWANFFTQEIGEAYNLQEYKQRVKGWWIGKDYWSLLTSNRYDWKYVHLAIVAGENIPPTDDVFVCTDAAKYGIKKPLEWEMTYYGFSMKSWLRPFSKRLQIVVCNNDREKRDAKIVRAQRLLNDPRFKRRLQEQLRN